MLRYLKYLLKKHFYTFLLKDKFSPTVQISLQALASEIKGKPYTFSDFQFNVFTYHGEDGLLFNLISRLENIPKTFADIGAGNCVTGNCANLAVNLGWYGLFIDANPKNIAIGKSFYSKLHLTRFNPPIVSCTKVTPANVNSLLKDNGFEGETGILSIDIDGNDYWIWKAIDAIKPWVVIIECTVEFGGREVVMPYSEGENQEQYSGSSILSFCQLARQKKYSLVSANRYGYNLIFLRDDVLSVSDIPVLSPEELLNMPEARKAFFNENVLNNLDFVNKHPTN
jgi:hypothetical protein